MSSYFYYLPCEVAVRGALLLTAGSAHRERSVSEAPGGVL